jgi:hypothetical protein
VIFSITSRELCADLAQLGVTPRKSLTLNWPKSLAHEYARPFLLGYFDGDGFITWSRSGIYRYPRWGLCGTQSVLLGAMRLITDSTGVAPRRVRQLPDAQLHVLHISGRDAWTVDRWLHADGELGLTRKRLDLTSRDAPAA